MGVFCAYGPAVDAEALGDGGAGDISVQNTDLIATAAHGNSQLAGDHGLAYTALTGYDTIDLAHMGVGMVGLQQGLRLTGSTALTAGGAIVRTFAHIVRISFSYFGGRPLRRGQMLKDYYTPLRDFVNTQKQRSGCFQDEKQLRQGLRQGARLPGCGR